MDFFEHAQLISISRVMISSDVTHRPPDFWPNPGRFDPDRFSPQQPALLPQFAYFPFGGGPWKWIGNTWPVLIDGTLNAVGVGRFLVFDPNSTAASHAFSAKPGLRVSLLGC